MPQYRSLVGGFYSADPNDKRVPASIRTNNPGAINGAPWIAKMPGFVTTSNLDGTNHASIFETPEQGVAVWWELMRRYQAMGFRTLAEIIWHYGGGQANYATSYIPDVVKRTGIAQSTVIPLNGDDDTLVKFARAMFRHEAGRESPLSDAQIRYGFKLARGAKGEAPEAAPTSSISRSLLQVIADAIMGLFRRMPAPKAKVPSPIQPPPAVPRWLVEARKDIGFHEVGANLGIETFIDEAHIGHLGDPWCAIFVNAKLEECGIPGTRSAMARSFENHKNFVRLSGPALGAIATFWRGSPAAGTGHVNFYAGTDAQGRHLGLGGNQSDSVNVSPMDMARHTGWWWPKGEPPPTVGAARVAIRAAEAGAET